MKKALVCGAGGFIGGHLVERLRAEGFWVRAVDIKKHEFRETVGDEFCQLDLREPDQCERNSAVREPAWRHYPARTGRFDKPW